MAAVSTFDDNGRYGQSSRLHARARGGTERRRSSPFLTRLKNHPTDNAMSKKSEAFARSSSRREGLRRAAIAFTPSPFVAASIIRGERCGDTHQSDLTLHALKNRHSSN